MGPAKSRLKAEPPTILIIDDDMDARRMYAEYLRVNRCIAFTAADGRSGIDKTNDLCPDVVVLDLAMPPVDGWTVPKPLRESSWTQTIPVAVGSAAGESGASPYKAGCEATLTRPSEPERHWPR